MAVAVVTGAAGAIGRSISTRLAKDGYAIALLDASPRVEEVYEEFKAADLPACSVQCNITEPEQVRQAYATVCDTLGRPSLLVNNAGIYELCPTAELSWERWKATIDTNLGGGFLWSQAFGVGMLEAGGGVIVNIASGRAFGGQPKGVHYAASKAGVVSLTRSLAQEWAPTVRVNCVVPGLTDTPMPRSAGATAGGPRHARVRHAGDDAVDAHRGRPLLGQQGRRRLTHSLAGRIVHAFGPVSYTHLT